MMGRDEIDLHAICFFFSIIVICISMKYNIETSFVTNVLN